MKRHKSEQASRQTWRKKFLAAFGKEKFVPQKIKREHSLTSRNRLLAALGMKKPVARNSWSQDTGKVIVFNAWQHAWERDTTGRPQRYPLRDKEHYNFEDSRRRPSAGHTAWHKHVDLVMSGKRKPIAIVPVATDPTAKIKSTKGWEKGYVIGKVHDDEEGYLWLYFKEFKQLNV